MGWGLLSSGDRLEVHTQAPLHLFSAKTEAHWFWSGSIPFCNVRRGRRRGGKRGGKRGGRRGGRRGGSRGVFWPGSIPFCNVRTNGIYMLPVSLQAGVEGTLCENEERDYSEG